VGCNKFCHVLSHGVKPIKRKKTSTFCQILSDDLCLCSDPSADRCKLERLPFGWGKGKHNAIINNALLVDENRTQALSHEGRELEPLHPIVQTMTTWLAIMLKMALKSNTVYQQ